MIRLIHPIAHTHLIHRPNRNTLHTWGEQEWIPSMQVSVISSVSPYPPTCHCANQLPLLALRYMITHLNIDPKKAISG